MSEGEVTTPRSLSASYMRMAANIVTDLAACSSLESLYERAARIIASKTEVERSAVISLGAKGEKTVYLSETHRSGLDDYQQLVDDSAWNQHMQALDSCDQVVVERDHGSWVALTAIRSTAGLLAVVVNDSPTTQTPVNAELQEVISACCALFSSVIEQKKTELDASAERKTLRQIIDSLPDYIYFKDTSSKYKIANLALSRFMGIDTPDQVVGKTDYDFFPEELAESHRADELEVMSTAEPILDRIVTTLDAKGNSIWLMSTKIPISESDGKVIGLIGLTRNITFLKLTQETLQQANTELEAHVEQGVTQLASANAALDIEMLERKRAEEALRRERNLLRTLIDTMPDYIFAKDREGRFILSNIAHAKAARVDDPNELLGKTAFEFFPPELAAQYDFDDHAAMNSAQTLLSLERRTRDVDGNVIWVSTTKAPLFDAEGKVSGLIGISHDITAYKEVQESLKQQEAFLRQVIDANPNLIFVKDRAGKFILSNRAHAEMLGTTVEAIVGKRDVDFATSKEQTDHFVAGDWEVLTTQQPKYIPEEQITMPTGEVRWLRTNKIPLLAPDGKTRWVLGVSVDISQRKQSVLALEESEERYRALTELISDFAFSARIDPNGQPITEWNTAASFQRITGYDMFELSGTLKLFHPDDVKMVEQALVDVVSGKSVTQECRIITRDGRVRWMQLVRKPVWDDAHEHVIRYIGIAQDITERKQAERALQQAHDELETRVTQRTTELSASNQLLVDQIAERIQSDEALAAERNLLRILIDNLPQYVYIKDTQARFVIDNFTKTYPRQPGSSEGSLGKTDFDLFPREMATQYYADDMKVIGSGEPLVNHEEFSRDAHGNPIWLLTTKLPLRNTHGEITGLVGIGMNITELKDAEQALMQARNQLEQRVDERTAELRVANEEVRRFAYIVSHDLRAPLVNIKGFAAELRLALQTIDNDIQLALPSLDTHQRDEVVQTLKADVPEALNFIDASVSRMDYLINAILKLSRMGRRQLQLEDIHTADLVQELTRSLAHQMAEHITDVNIGTMPNVVADRTAIEQIFGNILANAVLYLDAVRPGTIDIWGEVLPNETVYHIRDNGRGIDTEEFSKVFEPFRRAGKHSTPGEGMGLAYVQTLVRRHDGRIWFDSELGVGTTFSFSISNHLSGETPNA